VRRSRRRSFGITARGRSALSGRRHAASDPGILTLEAEPIGDDGDQENVGGSGGEQGDGGEDHGGGSVKQSDARNIALHQQFWYARCHIQAMQPTQPFADMNRNVCVHRRIMHIPARFEPSSILPMTVPSRNGAGRACLMEPMSNVRSMVQARTQTAPSPADATPSLDAQTRERLGRYLQALYEPVVDEALDPRLAALLEQLEMDRRETGSR
jgi:hypothetical protein